MENINAILNSSMNKKILDNKKTDSLNNGWSRKKEQLLQIWMDECNIFSKLYSYNVLWYDKVDKILGIISILLSATTGASLLNNANSMDNPKSRNIILAFGSLTVFNTIIQATKEYLNLKTVINSNLIAARQNRMICLDIEAQLNMRRDERLNGKEFLKSIKDRKNDLILNGPVVSDRIWKKLKPRLKNTAIENSNKYNFKKNLERSKEKILKQPETISSGDENSGDIVYKRRATLSLLNDTQSDNIQRQESQTNDSTIININDDIININNDINNVNNSSNKLTDTTIENITEEFELDTDNEDNDEDVFLDNLSRDNKASNEILKKLTKKPLMELKEELHRYHI